MFLVRWRDRVTVLDPTRSHSQTRLLPQRGIRNITGLTVFQSMKFTKGR